ncbi:hypothetical protein D3C78_1573770 [compost metagenome]
MPCESPGVPRRAHAAYGCEAVGTPDQSASNALLQTQQLSAQKSGCLWVTNQIGGLLTNHDRWGVGITCDQLRHD